MRAVSALALTLLAPAAPPPNGLQPEGRDVTPRYTADVRAVFAEAFGPDVRLRVLEEPSFRTESAVAVRRTRAGWDVVALKAGEQVWRYETLRMMRERSLTAVDASGRDTTATNADQLAGRLRPSAAGVPVARCERELPGPLAEALVGAWTRQVSDAHAGPATAPVMTDADGYRFAVRTSAGVATAMAWSPAPEAPAGRLVALADALARACGSADAAELDAMTREARALSAAPAPDR